MSAVDPQTYLREDEPSLARAAATRRNVGAVEGTLVVTPTRVVFAAEGGITDVAADAVTAIELHEARYPLWNAVFGVVLSVLGAILLAIAYAGPGRPVTTWLGGVFLAVGVVTLAVGLRDRAARLELHTPARSFEFAGTDDDLAEFPAAIRNPAPTPNGRSEDNGS